MRNFLEMSNRPSEEERKQNSRSSMKLTAVRSGTESSNSISGKNVASMIQMFNKLSPTLDGTTGIFNFLI